MRRRAFTLIEVMVAVALIAILGSLLVIGVGHLQTNSKRQQTHLIMQNLSAMFAEYDVARRVPFGMGHLNFSNVPTAGTTRADLLAALSLPCPTDVTVNAPDRTGFTSGSYQAVPLTRDFMAQMLAVSNNAAAVGKLPAGTLMTFNGVYPTGVSTWSAIYASTKFKVYDMAADYSGNVYIRTQLYFDPTSADPYGTIEYDALINGAPAGPPNVPLNYYYWIPVVPVPSSTTPLSTPVPLDAWGNPIIFVMGGVLGTAPGSATGTLTAGGNNFQVVSPDYRPFFASAGPDGNFSLGDDNIYSFEK